MHALGAGIHSQLRAGIHSGSGSASPASGWGYEDFLATHKCGDDYGFNIFIGLKKRCKVAFYQS